MAELLSVFIQMEGGVEELAHDESLPELRDDLLLPSEGLHHHEGVQSHKRARVEPNGQESGSHDAGAVVLLEVEHVSSSEGGAEEEGNLSDTLGVVESVDDSFVLLPVVVIHSTE